MRPYNFSAGPAILPPAVFERAAAAVRGLGGPDSLSILEISHRSPTFAEIHARAIELCHEVLEIPRTHTVLFLQGGASQQFAMVPMNLRRLAGADSFAAFVDTGVWSSKAIGESEILQTTRVVASSAATGYDRVPVVEGESSLEGASYLHVTGNNTIYGTEWPRLPKVGVPLVVDLSSHIGSRRLPFERVALGYAGAQKNLGPSGVTLVFADKALLERLPVDETVPQIFRYATHTAKGGLFNTPNTFGVLVLALMLEWLRDRGGLAAIAGENEAKAGMLYDALDSSSLFVPSVPRPSAASVSAVAAATLNTHNTPTPWRFRQGDRSRMNVTWTLGGAAVDQRDALTKRLLGEASSAGLVGLKGHRSAGGLRASLYNAFPRAGVAALVEFLAEFERRA